MLRKSRFLGVEIVIRTDADCDAFIEWFQSQDNYVEKIPGDTHRWYVYFSPLSCGSADETIRNFCEEISGWPNEVLAEWNNAAFREFFVGYEIGSDPVEFQDHFDPRTLNLAAQIGAGIGLALYPSTMGCRSGTSNEDEEQRSGG